MDVIELVVRVDFVPEGLVICALVEVVEGGFVTPERLCLPANGAFFTPSETEARGRVAVDEDLTDAVEPVGETTERVDTVGFEVVGGAGLDEVDDDKGGFEVEEDKDGLEGGGAEDLGGTTEARRAGPVDDVPVEGAFATGVGLVGLDAGAPALTDFLRVEAAEEALLAAEDATLEIALEAGATFTEPTPNVPEFSIYVQNVNMMAKFNSQGIPF